MSAAIGAKRRHIPVALSREISAHPCAVCGGTFRICVDHVTPVICGGGNEPANLQPLCWQCNAIKKGKPMGNSDIAAVVATRGVKHFLRAEWEQRTYHLGYDRLDFRSWCERRGLST